MSKNRIIELYDLLTEAQCSQPESGEGDLQSVLRKIEDYVGQNPLDGEGHYLLGYYHFHQRRNKDHPEIEKHLARSLELEPKRPFPLFYLGMYYFNCGVYEKSLSVLSDIDLSYFESIQQHYRISEVIEVKMCDRLYTSPHQVEISEVAKLADELFLLADLEAKKLDVDISACAVTPYALARCIDSLFQKSNMEEKALQMFEILFQLLLKIGQQEEVARKVDRMRLRLAASASSFGTPLQSC